MAKPKKPFHIATYGEIGHFQLIHLWCDDLNGTLRDISPIEGISSLTSNKEFIEIIIDPRYDIHDVEDEIKELLTAQISSVFRED